MYPYGNMVPQSKWAHLLQGIVSSLFPKENGLKFPRANGLKFLVETCLLGQMHQSFRRKCGCMGQMGPSSLGKHVGNMSPKEHVFTRNFNPFVSGNHISLRNLNPFALGKLQVLSPRGSWGNLVKSLSPCKLQLPFSLGKLAYGNCIGITSSFSFISIGSNFGPLG